MDDVDDDGGECGMEEPDYELLPLQLLDLRRMDEHRELSATIKVKVFCYHTSKVRGREET